MISGKSNQWFIRTATFADLDAVKSIADAHRHELGFVILPSLREQIERGQMLVAMDRDEIVGFVDYHHRRDGQITLYHIAVEPEARTRGIGRALLDTLLQVARQAGSTRIVLKCPVDLQANQFYGQYGFQLVETLNGRKRALNEWVLEIEVAGT